LNLLSKGSIPSGVSMIQKKLSSWIVVIFSIRGRYEDLEPIVYLLGIVNYIGNLFTNPWGLYVD
jgi:hypothetical protein